jgi:hypothetical protein
MKPVKSFLPEMERPLNLPKIWCMKSSVKGNDKEENWQIAISMTATCKFDKFAFINFQKLVYLAFVPLNNNFKEIKIGFPNKSYASHGRNQLTKDQLFFV